MAKVQHTVTGCVPVDKSVLEAYVALNTTNKAASAAEDDRQEAEGQGDYSDTTLYPNTRRAKEAARQAAETERIQNEGSGGPDSEGYSTSRIKKEIDRQTAETQRQENEGIGETDAECAPGSRRKNESIRQANEETRQSNEETRQAQEGTPEDEASATGSRWARYKKAEADRETAYETAEGESSDAASASGSRWARYKKAEADRETAYDTAEAARDAAMAPQAGFYACATGASTAAKVVAATNYVLTNGGSIKVKFTYANSAASPTLNINSTGAKAIVYNGAAASATNTWAAGDVVEFYYDPTYNSNAGAFVGIPTVVSVSQNTLTTNNKAKSISVGGTDYNITDQDAQDKISQLGQKADVEISNIKARKYYADISGGYISKVNGQVVEASGYNYSDYIPVAGGEQFKCYIFASSSVGTCFYDSSKTFILGSGINCNYGDTFTVPAGAVYMRISTSASFLGRFVELITTTKSLQDIQDPETSPVWEKYSNTSDENVDSALYGFGVYNSITRREWYNMVKTLRLYGFDKTKKHTLYLLWSSTNIFSFRISEQRGDNDWVVVFDYTNAQFFEQRLYEFPIDLTISGKRVVALLDTTALGVSDTSGVFNALNSNPEYIIAKPCYMDVDVDEYTAGSGISINADKVVSVDENSTSFPKIIKTGEPNYYNVVDSQFSISGFINTSTGVVNIHSTYVCTDFLPCSPGQKYLTNTQQYGSAAICFYNANKAYINEYYQNSTSGVGVFTVPAGAAFMRLSSSVVSNRYANLQNYSYKGLEELTQDVNKLSIYDNPFSAPIKLFPQTKLPVISFQFDDNPLKDQEVVDLFKQYHLTCAFAFIASESNILEHGPRYLDYQKQGFQIMSHSVDGTIFNTTNYTYQTAMAAIMTARNRIQAAGMISNGFVAPSSSMDESFIPILKAAHAYAFTTGTFDPVANGRTQDTCQLHRCAMESHTLQELEAFIDSCITNDQIITMYGHAAAFVDDGDTSVWSIAKIEALIQYCIAKRDAGLLFIGGTDECVKYFFDL